MPKKRSAEQQRQVVERDREVIAFDLARPGSMRTSHVVGGIGWWWLRQQYSRADLVDMGVCSRASSYRLENEVLAVFGKPPAQLTEAQIRRVVQKLPNG